MVELTVIGGGLAGSEAAWEVAERRITVRLHEMRPEQLTPAHTTGYLAEMVHVKKSLSDLDTSVKNENFFEPN
jgi:folate-dependent tRNA-U54 methylase TrmFO/GidA